MGIFTRFRDIISSNINAMLDKAEDPEKLISLMIQEMEDTLVEIKASCAAAMATSSKGRDDLAREALLEKRRYADRAYSFEKELQEMNALIQQYQEDIKQLEEKLRGAREKQRLLVQRHVHALKKRRAQEEIRRMDSTGAVLKFEEFENRIERMEAEAELVNFGRKPALETKFEELLVDDEIEKELQTLKSSLRKEGAGTTV
ncbi:MAG: pspA2 [Deltaproteobacteria bacterium]|nr:pspA2 [Deltaproteobacteria bacterium]